ncbi:MAG TPA: PAS domain-containing sensor histidine kinase [Acidimicrobiales bacterium]|nr:PAS domain-containing sensor histidine kinase [Acidimicrobiales bacterium]
MTSRSTDKPHLLTLSRASELLGLAPDAVKSLVTAGYLQPVEGGPDGPAFTTSDVKAFMARNADNGSGNLFLTEPARADADDLLLALDGRSAEMARRAYDIFVNAFPDTKSWDARERSRFLDQAKARFEAILAVASQGAEVDEALTGDLQEVGAAAAWAGSPLPQLLVVLRISRDLVVQTAVELAEERGGHWSLPLALLLTRVLPAMDRLTDAIAQGYWDAVVGREAEQKARYQHVVEHSSDGVYEADLDGCLQYANPSLALILGRTPGDLQEALLTDVLVPVDGSSSIESLVSESTDAGRRVELAVFRPDGVRRVLEIRTSARRREGEVVGFQGVVRDVTTARDLEADKNEFLALMTYDLRQPLRTILGLGAALEGHTAELPEDRVQRMGSAVRREAERISRMADDLYDISRLEAQALLLSPRPVDLTATVDVALAAVDQSGDVRLEIPEGLVVVADPRRLEQVIANLVENALAYGAPPVIIRATTGLDGAVEIAVIDHGSGVPPSLVPSLFNRLRLLARRDRDRDRGTGLGLSLVKGLVEAMGGRVWYEPVPDGGANFRVRLPTPAVGT